MKRSLFILGGIGVLGYGIYRYLKTQSEILKAFTWKISSFRFKKFSLTELTLDITFLFTSDADIEATVNKLYLDVYIEDNNVGFIKDDTPFVIPAHGSTNIPLVFSVNPQYVLRNVINVSLGAAKKKDIKLGLKGYANIKSGFISTTIPIDYSTTVKEYLGIIPTK